MKKNKNIIGYLGSKVKLYDFIDKIVLKKNTDKLYFIDLFAGTCSVSKYVQNNYKHNIILNDLAKYVNILGSELKLNELKKEEIVDLEKYLHILDKETEKGYFFNEFSMGGIPKTIKDKKVFEIKKIHKDKKGNIIEEVKENYQDFQTSRMYFKGEIGKKIDGIKNKIKKLYETKEISEEMKNILILFLLNFTDKNSNTTSVYGAYLKHDKIKNSKPFIDNNLLEIIKNKYDLVTKKQKGKVTIYNDYVQNTLVKIQQNFQNMKKEDVIVYMDPPYNSRSYESNYHILEYLVDLDFNPIKTIKENSKTGMKNDKNKYNNPFNSKTKTIEILKEVIEKSFLISDLIYMSYNNEGIMKKDDLKNFLEYLKTKTKNRYELNEYKQSYKRYTSGENSGSNNGKKNTVEEIIWELKQYPKEENKIEKINAIELFAGVGGFRLGLESQKDINVIWSNQWEPSTKKQHASEVYEKIFGSKNHSNQDIKEIDSQKIPSHKILCGGNPCFTAGHKVLTEKGYEKIEKIKKGTKVLTHTNQYKKVLATMNRDINELIKIKFYGSKKITTTPNHSFYVIKKTYKDKKHYEFSSQPQKIQAKDLNINEHYVAVNINNKSKIFNFDISKLNKKELKNYKKTKEFKTLKKLPTDSKEFWWFIGKYLSNGGCLIEKNNRKKDIKYNPYIICNYKEENNIEEQIKKLNIPYLKKYTKTVVRFNFNNILLTKFIKIFENKVHNKEIPITVQNLPINLLISLEQGYLSENTLMDKKQNKVHKLITTSENLSLSFQNIIHKIYKLPCKIVYTKDENIYILHYRTTEKTKKNKILYRDGKLWFPLKKKSKILKKETKVYNIEVEEDHTYNVNNLTCFNCQDFSVMRPKNQSKGLEGKKGVLFWEIHRIAKYHNTEFLLLENVDRQTQTPSHQKGKDFAVIIKSLLDLNYIVEWRIINAAEYGFPQKRRRTFIFAYKENTKLGKKILKEKSPKNILEQQGLFPKTFPIKSIEEDKISTILLEQEIFDISVNFNKETPNKKPFFNSGIAIKNKVYTIQSEPDYKGKYVFLKDILLEDKDIPEEFFVTTEEDYQKWVKAKGKISKPRIDKKTGKEYIYKGGALPFPDKLDSPARTIITSEGGKSASRTTHIINPEGRLRRLHPIEMERIQGFPDNHTKLEGITNPKRGFLIGNALVIGVVEKIAETLLKEI